MRLRSKRAIDYYVGRPLLTFLELAARVLALVLHRDHAREPVRSILLVKFQGVGSLVICKPALAALRKHYPHARIIFWGTPSVGALAIHMPEVDEVLVLDDGSLLRAARTTLAALLRLWRARIDWAFDLEVYSRLSSALVTLTMARNRTGFALEQLRARRVHTHLIYFNRYHHVGDAYSRIVGQVLPSDAAVDPADYGTWRFALDPLLHLPRPYVLVNIHAGDLSLERRWPLASFQRLIRELLDRRPDMHVILIGHGPAEIAYTKRLPPAARVLDLSGQLNLVETFRAIANAELVITNDSAPLHFAISTHVKVLALFGPTRAATYLPPGRPDVLGTHVPLYCSPCVHHWEPPPCGGDNQCMKRLTVEQVFALCGQLLGDPSWSAIPLQEATVEPDSDYYPGLVYKRPGGPHAS
jgi:ADP-heptose:LPS heptosyltransferase